MKKYYFILLLVFYPMLVCAYDIEVDGIYYNLNKENLTASVTYKDYWAEKKPYVGYVEIPQSIVYDGLNYIITSIDASAFQACKELKSITIPEGVITIGSQAFNWCDSLISISLPNSIISIGTSAFHLCSSLKKINLPTKLSVIEEQLFYGCNNLTTIIIPDGVKEIKRAAFADCSNIETISIPNSVEFIGNDAFRCCSKLKSINIPNKLTVISHSMFQQCYGLESIILPESIKTIEDEAFYYCSGLKTFIIGKNIESIGKNAFQGCRGLLSVEFHCKSIDSWFKELPNINKVIIGNEVTQIKAGAFSNCSGLVSVTIPSSVVSIENNAFYGTQIKKTIWLTNTPPSGYFNLMGVENYVANDQYSSLSPRQIYPFLSSIFEVNGVKYVPTSPSERTCDAIDCLYDSISTQIVVDSTVYYKGIEMIVKNVRPYLCANNNYIKKVKWNYKGDIPDYAFANCDSLEDINIFDYVSSIGKYSFQNCKLSNSITIPENISQIGDYAFSGCSGIKTLVIEDRKTVLSLGSNDKSPLFASCPLDSVYIGGDISYSTISNKGYSPFYRNTSLRTVVITDEETEISPNEFYGCTNLRNVKIGDGITTISDWAFSGCSSLKYFSFGSKVSIIGKEAFSDCTSVTSIISRSITPPTCGTQALDDINKWDCVLTVPKGCKSDYMNSNQWKDFFFIEEDETLSIIPYRQSEAPTVKTIGGNIYISGVTNKAKISVYNTSGMLVGTVQSNGNMTVINTNMNHGDTAILKIGERIMKIIIL